MRAPTNRSPVLMDYHLHTSRCRHASGTMEAYVRAALEKGIQSIGFADHAPTEDGFDQRHRMDWHQFDGYVDEVRQLRNEMPEIEILLGIEADMYDGFENSLTALRERFPIDYVIGSVHYADQRLIFHLTEHDISPDRTEEVLKSYVRRVENGIATKLVDIVGHLDVIKYISPNQLQNIHNAMGELFDRIAAAGIIVELNTSGLRKKIRRIFPDPLIIRSLAGRHIPFCLSSDAHQPSEVGDCFPLALEELAQAGYSNQHRHDSGLLTFTR